jgi:hypothetical protein
MKECRITGSYKATTTTPISTQIASFWIPSGGDEKGLWRFSGSTAVRGKNFDRVDGTITVLAITSSSRSFQFAASRFRLRQG